MKTLRSVHLYLGCVFAPLLTFFAISGLWQMLYPAGSETPTVLRWLSTVHTGRSLKVEGAVSSLSSPYLQWLIGLMAVSLVFTITLGVVMAFKFGRGQTALACLAAGIAAPCLLVLLAVMR